jgi:uncharacterized protein
VPDIRTAILLPVGTACNLDCSYCCNKSAPEDLKSKRMSEQVLARVFAEVGATASRSVKFAWHGGEPLLAGLGFFEQAMDLQRQHVAPALLHGNHVQTNGTLVNAAWAGFLSGERFTVGVSIDGPSWLHDRSRPDAGGGSTFANAESAVHVLRSHDVDVGVSVVCSSVNVAHPDDVFEMLVRLGVRRIDVNIAYNPTEQCDLEPVSEAATTFMCRLFDLWIERDDPELRFRTFEGILTALLGGRPRRCLWRQDSCPHYVSFGPDGTVYPCSRFLGHPSARFGNVMVDGLSQVLSSAKATGFYSRVLESKTRNCASCRVFSVCGGGCGFEKFTGLWGEPDCRLRRGVIAHVAETLEARGRQHILMQPQG